LKNKLFGSQITYEEMNKLAGEIPIGSDNLTILPFGNGAERVLKNSEIYAAISGLNFNIHGNAHLLRAAQEGIVFSLNYGMGIMQGIGINPSVIRAGHANMFLSPVFRETLAGITGATIELYNTDGSIGAARGAGIGAGYYESPKEAFSNLKKIKVVQPDLSRKQAYEAAYDTWLEVLKRQIR